MATKIIKHRGSWTPVAKALTEAGYPTSRQMVYQWYRRRDKIGFPEGETVTIPKQRGEGTVTRVLLDIAEVIEWRKGYQADPGGRPRKDR